MLVMGGGSIQMDRAGVQAPIPRPDYDNGDDDGERLRRHPSAFDSMHGQDGLSPGQRLYFSAAILFSGICRPYGLGMLHTASMLHEHTFWKETSHYQDNLSTHGFLIWPSSTTQQLTITNIPSFGRRVPPMGFQSITSATHFCLGQDVNPH